MAITEHGKDVIRRIIENNERTPSGPFKPRRCYRCGGNQPKHGTRDCTVAFDEKRYWTVAELKTVVLEPKSAEKFYQDELQIWRKNNSQQQQQQQHNVARGKSGFGGTGPTHSQHSSSTRARPTTPGAASTKSASSGPSQNSSHAKEAIANLNLGKPIESTIDHEKARIPAPTNEIGGMAVPKMTLELGSKATAGDLVIMSNYVRVAQVPKNLYYYSLKYSRPNTESTSGGRIEFSKRREIEGTWAAVMKVDALGLKRQNIQYATNFKELWTTTPIPNLSLAVGTMHNTLDLEYLQLSGKQVDDLRAEVCYMGGLDDIEQKLRSKKLAELPDYIRALNAIFAESVREHASQNNIELTQVGANKFFLDQGYKDMTGLRAVRGYFTSVRPGQHDTLLNVNTATSAFLPPILVSDFIEQVSDKLESGSKQYAAKLLYGATVRIMYNRQNFKDSGVDLNSEQARCRIFKQIGLPAGAQKFFELEPRNPSDPPNAGRTAKASDPGKTVKDHFIIDKQVSLAGYSDRQLLCVNVGKRFTPPNPGQSVGDQEMRSQSEEGAIWIPACLLEIVPDQVVTMALNAGHTTEMISNALRRPGPNVKYICEEGFQTLGLEVAKARQPLARMGMKVEPNLIRFVATKIHHPEIFYGRESALINFTTLPAGYSSDLTNPAALHTDAASWSLQGVGFSNPKEIRKVQVLALQKFSRPPPDESKLIPLEAAAKEIATRFAERLRRHNVRATPGDGLVSSHETLHDALQDWYSYSDLSDRDCTLVLLLETNLDDYAAIKRAADLTWGKHTLCAVKRKVEKGDDQFLSHLAMKANLKAGGDNHHLSDTQLDQLLDKSRRRKTIILGADVTHPGKGCALGSPSIACVVGSVDDKFMNYPGSMRLQAGGQEQIEERHLCSMIKERILAWSRKRNGALPTSMLFYRDGVSESQFKACSHEEIPHIKQGYLEAGGKLEDLQLTFVIVGKRHNTRFYPTTRKDTYTQSVKSDDGKTKVKIDNGNLKPGLLVENVVTNPSPYNFFLQSHCAIVGTARSAHYHALLDDMGLGPDLLPNITMLLCFAFGRATKGVSYVAPAYIADRLCERGRAYLRQWNNGPGFKLLNNGRLTKEQMLDWKRDRAEELAQSVTIKYQITSNEWKSERVWGHYNSGSDKKRPIRLNPWHPNFDDVMFWM